MSGELIHAGYAIQGGKIRRDFAVYVEAGRIVTTGDYDALRQQFPQASRFGSSDYMMLPGFVNAHDHGRAIGAQSLGVGDSFLEVWLNNLGRLPSIPPYLAAAWEGLQLAKSGVTSIAHSHNPQSWDSQFTEVPHTLTGYADAGIRVALHPVIIDQNPLVYADADTFIESLPAHLQQTALASHTQDLPNSQDYFTQLTALYHDYHDAIDHRVHIQVSPAGGQWCSDDLILQAIDWAKGHQSRVQMHMLETYYQQQYAHKMWQCGFIRHLADIGALGDWLTLAHVIWVEDQDFAILAQHKVGIVHNPSSNLRLRSGIAPFAKFHQAAVGMDGHTLDEDHDYLRELRLAWTLANAPKMSSSDVSAIGILQSATEIGAATTFGDDVPLGRLQNGYLADLVLLDWTEIRGQWMPASFLVDTIISDVCLRRATKDHVRHVMVHGEWVVRDGKHQSLDEDDLAAQIRDVLSEQNAKQNADLEHHIRRFYAQWDNSTP